jgi:mannose-6-phosphate isomerase-like protein (cupin superfamily)
MNDAVFLPPGAGESFGSMVVKVARPELTVIEFDARADFGGADSHFHKLQHEAFYVLAGTIEFRVESEILTGAGALLSFPPGTVHSFVVGPGGARFLTMHAPGGFERYFSEVRELRASGGTPDTDFYARHDIYYV